MWRINGGESAHFHVTFIFSLCIFPTALLICQIPLGICFCRLPKPVFTHFSLQVQVSLSHHGMATWYKSQSHNNTFLAWLGMTPAGIHGRGMKEDGKQLRGVFCHFFPSGEVLSSVCAIWFPSRLKDETFSLHWHDCDLKSDILLPQNTFLMSTFYALCDRETFYFGRKARKIFQMQHV